MKTIEGKSGIKATAICDSVSEAGIRATTFELEVPRIVWCEFLTHSMLARNAASSRAIPFEKMQMQLEGMPVRFGKKSSGMQDDGENTTLINGLYTPQEWWKLSKLSAVNFSRGFYEAGYAKQIFNRVTEPYQIIKAVVTGTEWANFFWLRNDDAADPTLHELARCMFEARESSVPMELDAGEWHLPYLHIRRDTDRPNRQKRQGFYATGDMEYWLDEGMTEKISLEDAIKVSAARCAAVSFRKEDYSLEKSLEVYEKLVGADRKHASAFGHQCTPMKIFTGWKNKTDTIPVFNCPNSPVTWEPGISHADRNGQLWSAMMRGFIQYRKLIPGENYEIP